MEQKTKKSLNSALEGLLKRFEKGEKFVLAEAPAVCKELVIEILINNAMWIIFAFTAIVGGVLMVNGTCKYESDTSTLHGAGYAAIGVGAVMTVFQINELLILKLCPKVSLMRKIKDLLSTDKE